MSARLAAETERLKRFGCGFRYLHALDTELGRKVRREIRPGSRYRPGFLRVQHLGDVAAKVWTIKEDRYAEPPRYDFAFLHALWHASRRRTRTTVIAAWYLVAHEWGHYWLARSGLRNHERDADAFTRVVMEQAGFARDEVREACSRYHDVVNDKP